MSAAQRPSVLITGGAGYLGRALLAELIRADEPVLRPGRLRVFDRQPDQGDWPEGVEHIQGDILDPVGLREATRGVDLVFHLAALIDWGQHSPARVLEVNLEGTRRVLSASREAGVRGLVLASSLDAIWSGQPVHQADESWPYPRVFTSAYCESKAGAEQEVLAADSNGLRTLVLRPCSIWGEGDPYHLGSMLEAAVFGWLPRLGRGAPAMQCVYVGNAAHALALAGRAVLTGDPAACGQVFFVTDFEAKNLFDRLAPMLEAAGVRLLPWAVPRAPLMAAAQVIWRLTRMLRPVWPLAPKLTPFAVAQLCQEFTVRSDKAERLLGYRPRYSEQEAYTRAIAAARARTRRRGR